MKKKRGKPKINDGYTFIRIDRETHENLKQVSGKMKMAAFLRHFVRSINENDDLRRQVFYAILDDKFTEEFADKFEAIPEIDQMMIEAAVADNPDTKRVGWYDRQPDGTWKFNEKRAAAWAEKENARKDRLFTEHNFETVENMQPEVKDKIREMLIQNVSVKDIATYMGTIPEVIELVIMSFKGDLID